MSDAVLREHGTPFMRLKTVNIIQAADADLRLMEKKREGKAPDEQHYSFANRHVHRARGHAHLVSLAYFEPLTTDKPSTLLIYNDRMLLLETLLELLTDELEQRFRFQRNT